MPSRNRFISDDLLLAGHTAVRFDGPRLRLPPRCRLTGAGCAAPRVGLAGLTGTT